MKALLTQTSLLAALLLSPRVSHAFCRTTTCDPEVSCNAEPEDCCIRNAQGCDTNGIPIAWPTTCVSYAIQKDGSAVRDITAEQLSTIVDQAFATWTETICETGLSIATENYGEVNCRTGEFNTQLANANVWMFRDTGWSTGNAVEGGDGFDASALAVTTTNFNWKNGQLYDADVELNADQVEFTLPDQRTQFDLLSIVTHEAGHFLGLDHSSDSDATMHYAYAPPSIAARSLSPDDEAGLCAAYPEDRDIPGGGTCDPRRGFVKDCLYDAPAAKKGGCSLAPVEQSSASLGLISVGLAFALLSRRGTLLSRRASKVARVAA
jgi:hypothetical protein